MNSFRVIDIVQTHTDASLHVPTFSRIYDTLEKLSIPFRNEKLSVDMMKDSFLGAGEMCISTDQFLSFPGAWEKS